MTDAIRLEKLHIDFADDLAVRRQNAAVRINRPGKNGAPKTGPAALAIHVLGARTEAAGKLYLNPIKWHAYVDKVHGVPDLDDFIDVKGIRKSWHKLIVQKDDPKDWAYLLIDASMHPDYRIVGWCWGHEAQQKKFEDDPVGDRKAYFVRQDCGLLRSPGSLLQIVRSKCAHSSEA